MGQIITFYSYKGGVGRTMGLANVAVLLARWGYKTLIVDWDLEAPGLEYFFKDYIDAEAAAQSKGVVDLLHSVSGESVSSPQTLDWQHLVISVQPPDCKQPLHMLTSGQRGDGYFGRVRAFDVETFYAEKGGGLFIESLRDDWKRKYDFVLLDSRTGVTDIGGICTIQLPDLLVTLFTATEQGFEGIVKIAQTAAERRQHLPVDRLRLVTVPLPSRFDSQVEFQISQQWLDRFAEDLSGIYVDWLPKGVSARKLIEATKIPYIPYFSFGEKLAVVEQGTTDPAGLGYAYETLAALIANNLESVEQVIDNRAEFVRSASRAEATAPKSEPVAQIITKNEFKEEWLAHHREWLESGGRGGRRLSLANAILSGINFSKVDLRKADFTEADLSGAQLQQADLSEAVLTGANLKGARLEECNLKEANLQNANLDSAHLRRAQLNDAKIGDANLRGANLSEAVLTDARMKRAMLTEADFYRAVLRRVSFEGCDVRRASFKEADLQDADLGDSEGLLANQLAGTNLSGARLRNPGVLDEAVVEFNSRAWFHRLTYAAMLLGCAFAVWQGVDYFSSLLALSQDSYRSDGAVGAIQATSLRTFGLIPGALWIFFFYFQFSLQSVWASLNAMPDVFPDGKSLDRKVLPGFVSTLVRHYLHRAGDGPHAAHPQGPGVVLCVWFAVPLTLLLLSFEVFSLLETSPRSLRPSIGYIGFLFLLFNVSILGAVFFWGGARRSLRRDPAPRK
ncbi:MAG TPA: pentapeptide repeat-containing protein [Pyrinomonadaceae bacterium]|nr:pentapeptide repeat-containing protein [Pyrinomonadaceae bacterium]